MSTQHLVLGKRIDFITGKIIVDTHNERVRQIIAKILINEKGFLKNDIELKRKIEINIEGNKGIVNVDFIVRVNGKVFMVIIFGPGSLVSRERSTLAAARLVESYEVSYCVITNENNAEVMETRSGKVVDKGINAILSKKEALKMFDTVLFERLP
ncbi:MAG: hypothetical protein DRH24_09565 [Deltaproteobacteria bacterium]|nr:MAG: hypothetical protein DRH24_09565 [Deltaproteobacteria bacterium]